MTMRNVTARRDALPPGPSGLPVVGRQREFLRDPLGFLTRAHHEHGDLVTLPLNGGRVVAAFGAGLVEAVNGVQGAEVEITGAGGIDLRRADRVQGRGPLNSTGTEHALYRRVSHRALGRESMAAYAAISVEETERLLARWSPGTPVDLVPEATALTRRIFKIYMFGSDPADTAPEVDAAVDLFNDVLESLPRRLATTLIPIEIPGLAERRRLARAGAVIDAHISTLIDRPGGSPGGGRAARPRHYSLAQAMLRELDTAGLPQDPTLVRDLMLQLHFAGLTSVASSIVWALLLLALNPEPARRMLDELERVPGGRVPTPDDARALPYVEAVLNESIRLYPAAAWEFKRIVDPLELGGYRLGAGTSLLLAPWVTQRSARSFDDPLSFRPERFLGDSASYESGAFLPWGAGERSCIGKQLARHAFRAVVGGISARYRVDLVADQRIDPHAGYLGTRLLPRPGVWVVPAVQDGDTARSAARIQGSCVGAADAG